MNADNYSQYSKSDDLLLRSQNQKCKNGFMRKILSKFKYALHKSQTFHSLSKILVVYSDTANFSILLYLLNKIIQESSVTDQTLKIYVLYINENMKKTGTGVQELINRDILLDSKSHLMFEYCTIFLSDFFDKEKVVLQRTDSTRMNNILNDQESLHDFLNRLWDTTAKQDFLFRLRNKLIIDVAEKLNCTVIFMNDLAADISSEILTNVVLGKGLKTCFKSSIENKKDYCIKVLYPLQCFTKKDIHLFLLFINYHYLTSKKKRIKLICKPSVQDITKQFIFSLNKINNFQTSTVCNLIQKIQTCDFKFASVKTCKLCQKTLNSVYTYQRISSDFARLFSKFISTYNFTLKYYSKGISLNPTGNLTNIYYNKGVLNSFSKHNYKNLNIFNKNRRTEEFCYACIIFLYKCNRVNL